MVPVAANHAADVIDGHQLPAFVADMLPTRNLFEHQQPNLVATIEEVARLRIVRGAHDVAVQPLAENVGVFALYATGHCLSHKRKSLMAIEAAQLDDLSVE